MEGNASVQLLDRPSKLDRYMPGDVGFHLNLRFFSFLVPIVVIYDFFVVAIRCDGSLTSLLSFILPNVGWVFLHAAVANNDRSWSATPPMQAVSPVDRFYSDLLAYALKLRMQRLDCTKSLHDPTYRTSSAFPSTNGTSLSRCHRSKPSIITNHIWSMYHLKVTRWRKLRKAWKLRIWTVWFLLRWQREKILGVGWIQDRCLPMFAIGGTILHAILINFNFVEQI